MRGKESPSHKMLIFSQPAQVYKATKGIFCFRLISATEILKADATQPINVVKNKTTTTRIIKILFIIIINWPYDSMYCVVHS